MAGRSRQTTAATLAAPVGGLNDRDALASMPASDAVILENWWPEPGRVSVRQGYTVHATGISGAVETIIEYNPPSGAAQLFAAAGGNIYDVTTPGAVGEPVVTGQTNARYQIATATTAGGSFLYAFNGADKPLLYDGTAWAHIDDTTVPTITGLVSSTIVDGVVFKGRLYLVEGNSLSLWYLPPAQIGGAASKIDMGQIFQRGGRIVTARTWTIDSGAGSDDHFVVLSSNGEVAVFAGSDPSVVSGWSLVGVFFLGRPIGQRPAVKFGGDLLIICEDGVFPLGAGLLSATVDRRVALTDKIQNSIRATANLFKTSPGWELCLASDHSALILNCPGRRAHIQYVQNTLTGAWAKFTGMDANCWCYSSQGTLFGGDGEVLRAWDGNADVERPITADCLQAFSYFGSAALTKYFTLVRPYFVAGGEPSILYALNGDYVASQPSGSLAPRTPIGMFWNDMTWGDMTWGGATQQIQDWLTVGTIAKAAGLRLVVQGNGAPVEWTATDLLYTRGGLL